MIHFNSPRLLYLLPLLILPALGALLRWPKLGKLLKLLPPSRRVQAGELRFRCGVSALFFLIFLGCLIIALAGPHWGSRLVPETRGGADLVLALDLSRSMEVRDMRDASGALRSRLETSAALAGNLTAALPGLRVAIALGKGSGVLALPLTDDHEPALAFLAGLSPSILTGRGTNLEALIDAASGAFQDLFPSRRRILLFSDGEALSGSLAAAAERALRAGISISAVGMGTAEGGPVLSGDAAGEMSALQREALQSAAARTGGVYLDGDGEHTAALLVEHLAEGLADSSRGTFRREPQAQWHIFVLAALGALGIAKAAEKKWRGKGPDQGNRARKRLFTLLAALAAAALVNSCSQVPGKLHLIEGSFYSARNRYTEAIAAYLKALAYTGTVPYAEYGLGCVYLALDQGQAAQERFTAALEALAGLPPGEHTELIYRIRYNLGIIHFQNQGFGAAAVEFRRALEAEAGKIEAKRNLELSLLSRQGEERTGAAPLVQGNGGGYEALFDYLRRKERDRWQSREWIGEEDLSGPDY